MANLNEYKCPCCGGAIEFDPTLQKLKCPYCDTEFDIETLKAMGAEASAERGDSFGWDVNKSNEWTQDTGDGLHVYICNSCGGEIIGDETLSATKCPYCGNPVVMTDNFAGILKPDWLLPFRLTKEQAKQGLKKHLHGKKLLPKVFKTENHIDEVKGIYVPFWLFNADADAHIRYKATKVRTWSDSDYHYTETSYYAVVREGELKFQNIPADGSSKMDDTLMESIEPFDISQAVDFQTAYLAGFLADKYDVTAEQNIERVNARVKRSAEISFENTVHGYNTVRTEQSSVNVQNGKAGYALFPVWILNTTWKNKKYTFAMNGQTGKFVGNLPIDKVKYWLYRVLWMLLFSGIASLVIYFLFVR